ncbi:helix-turn-helix transcriptional regulator [Phyllobacterium sp. SB3]|uniref:helix-turn-helix domain-containing protein n=1 Tax=Phyllobacterium sp. SB3 TaxID=3156073 RepID=UPI0032AE8C3A
MMTPKQKALQSAELFKERLKAARVMRGLTQGELATKAELSSVTISKLETGTNRPAFEIIVALSHALEIPPNFLLGWDGSFSDEVKPSQQQAIQRLVLAAGRLEDDWLNQLIALAEKAGSNLK